MLKHLFIYRRLWDWLEIKHYSLPLTKKKEVLNMNNNKHPYYGWYIVISATIIVLLSNGMRMGIGPFIEPVMDDLNLSRTELSIIVAIGMIVYGIGMPIAGLLLKTLSTRFMILTGLTISCLSILWTVNAKGLVSFSFLLVFFYRLGFPF